jgi:peptidoglycan/LPS O-acetylase OafA/YrhL
MATPRYRSIQALRGFAAVIVVLYHALHFWSDSSGHPAYWSNGAAGVDLFFVISGFVMAITQEKSSWAFMKRRIIRVVPLYWILTTVMVAKAATIYLHPGLAHGAPHAELTIPFIVSSYLFIPYQSSIGTLPILQVGWTLSFEMLFYAFFAIAISLRVNALRLVGPVFAGLAILALFVHSPAVTTLANPILLEFIAGLWLGKLASSGKGIGKVPAIASGVLGLCGLFYIPLPSANLRPFTWGVSAFLIVLSAIGLERSLRLPEWTQKLGDASYTLYLSHIPIFSICYRLLNHGAFTSAHGKIITVATCMVLSLFGAAFVHRFIETPVTAVAKRWLTPKDSSVAALSNRSTTASSWRVA